MRRSSSVMRLGGKSGTGTTSPQTRLEMRLGPVFAAAEGPLAFKAGGLSKGVLNDARKEAFPWSGFNRILKRFHWRARSTRMLKQHYSSAYQDTWFRRWRRIP